MEASMSKRSAALTALLGLVAVAGYQNRDKIGAWIKETTGTDPLASATGAIDSVKQTLGDGPVASKITNGLTELVNVFKSNGQGDKAESWVSTGPNAAIDDKQVGQALGDDVVDGLVKQTGLTRDELLARLSKVLPQAVNEMTPDGKIP
jgi:uncharacterized protein YidB (DUF937 family)